MKPIRTFNVIPSLPAPLEPLGELAYNLRWAWNHDTLDLFRRLDNDLWEAVGHNPVLFLGRIDQESIEAASTDDGFLAHLARVYRDFDAYMAGTSTWFQRTHGTSIGPLVAYFSAEFGLTECLSIFAGGLGVLSGDHLKSASDLGLPLVGVGLLYQQGYFRQYLNEGGWQQEAYEDNDFHNLPLKLQRAKDGSPLTVEVEYPGRKVTAQIWCAQVGRVPLYLLDTNIPLNTHAEDRDITDQLYGGDLEMRIKQEILLGIGGYRALQALGLEPPVCHINEGHSAFLALERIRQTMNRGKCSFHEAQEAASAGLVFTTHTPVVAGHDTFPAELIEKYFSSYARELSLTSGEFFALGAQDPNALHGLFCMTTLALNMAAYSNGVSRLHGEVSRKMWSKLWPQLPENEVPITHVTNGVHFQSWISRDMKEIYDRYLGPRWRDEPANARVWERADHIAAEELWRTHERRRERLVGFVRQRLRKQLRRRGASQTEIEAADEVLSPNVLTIGFARRFATYKRATLLLRDPDRLARIVNDPDRPVQLIFAGKAHPKDNPGKELIRQVVALSRQERFRSRFVFVEEYDMAVARYMVQGVDVWLNNPRRPREASGTSGMKAAANGVLNLSILDGWWDEAAEPDVGWTIGRRESYEDQDYQDHVEAEDLYGHLERDLAPTFYNRAKGGLPREWIQLMKTSIRKLSRFFNTHRMVGEYADRFYVPTADRFRRLTTEKMARAKALAKWKEDVRKAWPLLNVEVIDGNTPREQSVGAAVNAQTSVYLGPLTPEDVTVELYLGRVNSQDEIVDARAIPLKLTGPDGKGRYLYETEAVACDHSGLHGYTVRILPSHPDLTTPFLKGLILWA